MRKIFFSIILVIGIFSTTCAQDYQTGIGLRGGTGWGITVKHFLSKRNAFEGLLYAYNNGYNVTGLYEFHDRAFDVDNLRWYHGFGAHAGSYNYDTQTDKSRFVIGIDGVLGIEYTFTEAPVNIGIDWNPYLNLAARSGLYLGNAAISIRYFF